VFKTFLVSSIGNHYAQAFERCSVRGFNLSFASMSSFDAMRALQVVEKTDPCLWAELTGGIGVGNEDVGVIEEECDPFGGEGDDDDTAAIDTAIDLDETNGLGPIVLGLAEELDPGEMVIPDHGRSKRQRTANKRYLGEWVDSDTVG
jgi:hypothetical protein